MIIVRMTLVSGITGKHTDLGSMVICNDGKGTDARGNYTGHTVRKNAALHSAPVRWYSVEGHRRKAEPVWSLVRKMLVGMGY